MTVNDHPADAPPAPAADLPGRLLGVWAHPDDEAYLSAGLMARTVDAGLGVTVITATRGEKGTDDPARFATEAFARYREQELRASLGELGVSDVRVLGIGDGEADVADAGRAVAEIAAVIADVRPDVIVTFGPDGITGHPDHRAVSAWTTEAWRREGRGRLWYATMTHDYIERHARLHAELGVFDDFGLDGPFAVAHHELAAEFVLDGAELDRKRRALAAHGSQTEGLAALMGEDVYRHWWREETFRSPSTAELSVCPLVDRRIATHAVVAS